MINKQMYFKYFIFMCNINGNKKIYMKNVTNKLIQDFGLIKDCEKHVSQCKCICCKFDDNYIVLYPGEFETTKLKKGHIKIIDDNYFGGKKAICLRPCNEDDFKPLDCKSYPYFPKINEKGELKIIKGSKCPLNEEELISHKKIFSEIWDYLIKNKEIFEWLKKIELIGYEETEL